MTTPLSSPPSATRKQRWREVLGWYGPRSSRAPRCAGDGDYVVGAGLASQVCRVTATSLGRHCAVRESCHEVTDWMIARSPASVLLLVDSPQLKYESLLSLVSASVLANVSLGIVTAADLPGLAFAAAKVVAAWTAPLTPLDDGVLRPDHLRTNGCSSPAATAHMSPEQHSSFRMLQRSWQTLTIMGHGDGAHLSVGATVLCGLWSEAEIGHDGRIVPGCTSDQCKKLDGFPSASIRLTEVRARHLNLLTCNGFTVGGDLYPSNVSLVLAAAEGFPAAVVGTIGQMAFTTSSPAKFRALVRQGVPLGQVVLQLNSGTQGTVLDRGYVMWGDPLWNPVLESTSRRDATMPRRKAQPTMAAPRLSAQAQSLRASEALERALTQLLLERCGLETTLLHGFDNLGNHRRNVSECLWSVMREIGDYHLEADACLAVTRLDAATVAWDRAFARVISRRRQ